MTFDKYNSGVAPWCSGCHYAQLHSTKPELKFCAVSKPARDVLEIRYGEDMVLAMVRVGNKA